MTRSVKIAPGEFYHIYQRGVDGRVTYEDDPDFWRFIALLHLANSDQRVQLYTLKEFSLGKLLATEQGARLVDIGAYCLMPNHYHILIREREEGNTAKFMQKMMTAYTMYFNWKYDRKGALFGAGYRAEHITDDRHLKYLFAYIHLNPLSLYQPHWKDRGIISNKDATSYLEEYPYSSFRDYCGATLPQGRILTKETFPEYFKSTFSFRRFIDEWISFSEAENAFYAPKEETE